MYEALYIRNGIAKKINANSISSRKDYLKTYRGHLFCPHQDCSAHLSFAETPTFANKKIFKTFKKSVHSEDCPYRITNSLTGNHYVSSETINRALSDRHKRDILKKLFYRNQESEETTTYTSYTPTTRKQVLSDTEAIAVPTSKASIDPDALPSEKGTREPIVKKRRCSDIIPEDDGKLLALDGYAKTAVVSDDFVEIILESNTTLVFFNAFKDSSASAFSLVRSLASSLLNSKQDLLICFIGLVESKPTGYQIQIMDPSLISFNDSSIFNYSTAA